MTYPWPPEKFAQKGWRCPVCSRVYAPWLPECLRCKEVAISQNTNTTKTQESTA